MWRVLELSSDYEECVRRLNRIPNMHINGERISVTMRIPHSGFRFYSPQIIDGKIEQGTERVVIRVFAHPSIAEIILILLLSIMCVTAIALLFLGKSEWLFCLLLNIFTLFYIGSTLWQMNVCLENFLQVLRQ